MTSMTHLLLPYHNAKSAHSILIIIGGGCSITEGIDKGLWERLEGLFTIGLNYSYHYYVSTLQSYVDHDFYVKNKDDLEALPLIVGKHYNTIPKYDNTILLEANNKYSRDLHTGVYNSNLTGIFALSLGIHLLDIGEIYLLGYDYGHVAPTGDYGNITPKGEYADSPGVDKDNRVFTHFYQGDIKHRGIGKINYYNGVVGKGGKRQPRADYDVRVYSDEKRVKIYNVSMNSKISAFTKISYDEFLERIEGSDQRRWEQEGLREMVRAKLEAVRVKEAK